MLGDSSRELVTSIRTLALIDGFNLYHAIHDLGRNHLKWLDLRALCQHFAPKPDHDLVAVLYFTAFATWRPDSYRRHVDYVDGLKAVGVEVVLSQFKEKHRKCHSCGSNWVSHEEKETDVSIGVELVDRAHADEFDRALLVSADSDLSPAVRAVRQRFPEKKIHVLTPPRRSPSRELMAASGDTKLRRVKQIHLERSLLPAQIRRDDGDLVKRPPAYDPRGESLSGRRS